MNGQRKRKLKEVIRGLIGDGFHGTQAELAKLLKARGFRVTQSTVSRTMSQMGIVREALNGNQIYKLRTDTKISYRGSLSDLIVSISSNEATIVIKTLPGSAMFVAGFIDHECKKIVLGTIAGDDTIFVAPNKIAKISSVLMELTKTLRRS